MTYNNNFNLLSVILANLTLLKILVIQIQYKNKKIINKKNLLYLEELEAKLILEKLLKLLIMIKMRII